MAARLRKDELQYELRIRGISADGDANELRNRFSQCLSGDTQIVSEMVNSLNATSELDICEEKVLDLESLVEAYEGNGKDNEFRRISTRLQHVKSRVERLFISASAEEELGSRQKSLLEKVEQLILKFRRPSVSDVEDTLTDQAQPLAASGESSKSIHLTVPSLDSVKASQRNLSNIGLEERSPSAVISEEEPKKVSNDYIGNYDRTSRKFMPVYKWGLQFDSENGPTVGAFLDRVEELRRARGLSKQDLFESAVDLFAGTALIWYRSTIYRITSWDQLCAELKLVFQSSDYDYRLMQEIRNRIQGPQESIDLYLAAMDGLYGRLNSLVSEKDQLDQILRNINPYLQDKLCMFSINSVEELRILGRKAEVGRLRSSIQTSSSKPHPVLEPDLAWESTYRRKKLSIAAVQSSSANGGTSLKCWNCLENGHRYSKCTKPRRVFCYTCGTPDTKKINCPKCSSKNL